MNSRKAFFVSGLLPVLLITSCLQRGQQQLEKELEKHVRFLAGESCTGRKPGTDGYLLAANYADSIFNELGLKFFPGQNTSGYRQEFTLERFIPGEQTQLLLNSATGQARYNVNDDFILFHYGKVGGLVPEGEVVQVGEGLSEPLYGLDDLAGKDIRGRWVLMEEHITSGRLSPLPDELQSLYMDIHTSSLLRADLAADRGAVAVVLQSSGYDPVHWGIRAAAFSDYYAISGEGSPFRSARIPVLFAGPDLLDKLGDGSSVSLTLSGQIYKTDSIRTFNLIAVITFAWGLISIIWGFRREGPATGRMMMPVVCLLFSKLLVSFLKNPVGTPFSSLFFPQKRPACSDHNIWLLTMTGMEKKSSP